MALYYNDCRDIVDPLDDFNAEGWTTKQLEAEQERLKIDAGDLEDLIRDLRECLHEMQERVSDIEDALAERAEAEEEEDQEAVS